ncbi:MAG TPA: HAD-IIIC family phosphatase [Pyrinomonadaceae bacterium]|nr:HAD-IIIC family phosphatase [Pyrinomonadaceae bacterium]
MSTLEHAVAPESTAAARKPVKLLVWDLDNTLWQGTLLEGDNVRLREGVLETLKALDERGILHSVASKNDHEMAMAKLREMGVEEYFLYPQVGWNSKAASIRSIVESINIGMDAVAFIDDEPFEREEVRHSFPELLAIDARELEGLAARPEFNPPFITDESARRRHMYRADAERKRAEEKFEGPSEEFLASLKMEFTISPADEEDLKRAEELTVRTHQLNSTGYTYSIEELDAFRRSPDHLLLVADLNDKFGAYGKIGLALVEKAGAVWTIKLLLMSCRVMSRGVGTILLNHILTLAREAGATLHAEFLSNDRNRMMLVTYKFAGFKEVERSGNFLTFRHDLQSIQSPPEWVKVNIL